MTKLNSANWKRTLYYLRRNGLRNTLYAVAERLEQKQEAVYTYCEPDETELQEQREYRFNDKPLFSILVPTYCTPKLYLEEMIFSVLEQTYDNLELIVADATPDDSVEKLVQSITEKEEERYGRSRIRYHRRSGLSIPRLLQKCKKDSPGILGNRCSFNKVRF